MRSIILSRWAERWPRSSSKRQQEPAKLRIYIGAAPGVGKTYHMLNDALPDEHSRASDVVIGLVETHGRKETEAQIRDLEIIPQKVIPYRGVNLKEMDVDAIMARHPDTVVVDELAHTNVPGSKNRKRYEDVLELLDAGINVMTAVNIQHLETLNDAVNRSANTTIRETVPDSFFKRADEVVNVDMTVEELRIAAAPGKDLRAGKGGAVAGQLFPQGQPEHAARAVAAHHSGTGEQPRSGYRRTQGLEQAPIPEKVMVCLSTRPGTERLLARGRAHCRTAGDELVRGVCDTSRRRQGPRRSGSVSSAGRISAHGARSGRAGGFAHRPQCFRCADPVCAAGEHLARGFWAVGALALGHSVARLGAEPVSF